MVTTLGELAKLVGGTVVGDPNVEITGANTLSVAHTGDISFFDGAATLVAQEITHASAVLVKTGSNVNSTPTIEVDDVPGAFATIVSYFRPPRSSIHRHGISSRADISETASVSADVEVHAGAWIGDDVSIGPGTTIHSGVRLLPGCKIGASVIIFPNAVLYEDTVVGDRSVIHAGVVLGAYGFGYTTKDGRHSRGPQLGYVEIGCDVEIGANTTIDRGTYGPTVVGDGSKIDDLVMIGHNCRIGRHNILCSQVGIAGSTTTGDWVVMGGQAGIRDHVHIGTRSVLGAKAGVTKSVPDGITMLGIPAAPIKDAKLRLAAVAQLPEMRKQLKELEKIVKELITRRPDKDGDHAREAA